MEQPQPQHTETFTQKLMSQKRQAAGLAALLPVVQDLATNGTLTGPNAKLSMACLLFFSLVSMVDDARKTWRDVKLAELKARKAPLEREPTIPERRTVG